MFAGGILGGGWARPRPSPANESVTPQQPPAAPSQTAPSPVAYAPQEAAANPSGAEPARPAETPPARATREIVSRPPPLVPEIAGEEIEEPSDVERSRAAALAAFKARQVEHWIAQIAQPETGVMPFVLHESPSSGASAPETDRPEGLGRLYDEF